MKSLFKILLIISTSLMASNCADNLLDEFADKNDDDAILEQAKIYINDDNYTKAIEECSNLSPEFSQKANSRYVCAVAYAGSCGLNMLSFLTTIEAYNPATDQFLQYFMGLTGASTVAQSADCDTAEDLLQAIGATADRSDDQNLLMVFINLKKLQALTDAIADTDANDATDGGYDSCAISAANATSYASALWEVKESAGSTGITEIEAIGTLIDTGYCPALDAFGAQYDFCTAADVDSFTADQLDGVRSLVGETGAFFGIGDCGTAIGLCCGL